MTATGHTPSASAGAIGVTSPGAGDKEGTVSGEPGAGEREAGRRGESARERCDMMRATARSVRGRAVCFSRLSRESCDCRHSGLPKCWRNGSDVRVKVCGPVDSELRAVRSLSLDTPFV